MRKVDINSVKSGDSMAKPIWTENGNILIGAGVQLNERYIERLKSLGIDSVYIEDQYTSDIIPEDTIRDATRKKAVETVYKTMTQLTAATEIKRKVAVPNMGKAYHEVLSNILQDLSAQKDMLFNLTNLHSSDGYLFHHSVNVAILSGIVGIAKGYNRNQLMELGIGALLFDIGMTFFPDELWQKRAQLTKEERERLNKHTEEGFNLLRKQFDVSLLSAHCALQHHERYDGTGYPRGLKGEEIHEYARIVAIADVYCALTSSRPYRKAYSPNEAIEFLFANGNQWFDIKLIKVFVNHIAVYPLATTVLLNTGQVGVVSAINPIASHRPVIRIIQESQGVPLPVPYEVDLSQKVNVTIVREL